MDLIGQAIGNFVVQEKLGGGGMGDVYLARHPVIGSRAAVKVLHDEHAVNPTIVDRFFREAKAAASIGHPNIIEVLDFGRVNIEGHEVVYLLMELLDGESLSARIKRGAMRIPEVLHVMQQCCAALDASHQKGIVHRDLKPDNIHLVQRGADPMFVKLLDFGIAKIVDGADGGDANKLTRMGTVLGTPAYMSPEQCDGRGVIDHRSDIYSLGIVMYEMMTGATPFDGRSYPEMLIAHIQERTPPPSRLNPSVTPSLDAIVLHATEIDRDKRFSSMAEFARALERPETHLAHAARAATLVGAAPHLAGPSRGGNATTLSATAAEVSKPAPKTSGGGKKGLIAGVAALGIAGSLGLGFALLHGSGDAPKPQLPSVTPAKGGDDDAPATPKRAAAKPAVQDDDDGFIDVAVNSEPSGATVVHAGGMGKTPLALHVKRGSSLHVRLELPGYKTVENDVPTDRSRDVSIELVKLADEAKPAHASSHSSSHSSSHGSRSSSHAGARDDQKPAAGAADEIYTPKSLQF